MSPPATVPAVHGYGGDRGHPIERAIRRAAEAGRPAIAAFITGGYPDLEAFPAFLTATRSEADLVEVGVPFSDPMADGLTIQRSSRTALERGATLPWILDTAGRATGEAPILLMSYLNPILAYGFERLAADAASRGIAGLIVPDLPLEECGDLRQVCDRHQVALVQLVTPATPADRLGRVCAASRGFVYAVTLKGTTGGAADHSRAGDYLDRVRAASALPVLAGFGVRTAEDVRSLARHADGIIVGSALIEAIERGTDPAVFLRELRGGEAAR